MATAFPTALDAVTADGFLNIENVRSGKIATQSNSGATGAAALKVDFDPSASGYNYPATALLSVQFDDNSNPPLIIRVTANSASGGSPGSFTIGARGLYGTTDRNILVGERVGLAFVNEQLNAKSGAIIAIQTKIGIGADTPVSGDFFKGTGTGISGWSALTSGEVTTALTYTPVNKAGDTMSQALNINTDSYPQLYLAKASGSPAFTIRNDGHNFQFDKGNGSIGAGTYTGFLFSTIGNIDSGDPFWNALQLFGHSVTEGGTPRFPILAIFTRSALAADPTDYEAVFALGNGGGLPHGVSFNAQNNTNSFIRFGFGSPVPTSPQAFRISYVDGNNASMEFRGNVAIKNAANTKLTLTKEGHIESASSLGSVTAGTGAGTSPSVFTVSGTDTAGLITLTAGSSPTANANIVTVNYGVAYTAKPIVIITPASDLAGQHAARVYVDDANSTSGLFILKNATSALTASGAYRWYYHVLK